MTAPQPHVRRYIVQGVETLPPWLRWAVPRDAHERAVLKAALIRVLVVANLALGTYYITWRYGSSINWSAWWIAVPLVLAETYSFVDSWLFGLMMLRLRHRRPPSPPAPDATVDIFITCYNEPVELVRETALAARAVHFPHETYILDDGNSPAMRAMAEEIGVGYIVRSVDYQGRERHAKAGNLNNALLRTTGEFIMILDADQIARPDVLDRTLGYFADDPKLAFVQTPQYFYNVPESDPFGCQAPLFYGPIQQGKDGWNAAFFCGSNAVLRREALMQLGVTQYVVELEQRLRRALRAADRLLRGAERRLGPADTEARDAVRELRRAVADARRALRGGEVIQEITWEFQRRAEGVSRRLVTADLARIRAELAEIPGIESADIEGSFAAVLDDEAALQALSGRDASPLTAIEAVRALLVAVDVDRGHEAQPVMPMATISVTEDMATAMRLHALGWRSVYHHEDLVQGLAPEDLRTALQQRLRWAQGTIQVMLRENPLVERGLSLGQKLMYLGTMWSYLSGFFALVYLAAPICYLFFGWLPVRALSAEFFWHLLPYLAVNQLLFFVVGWKLPTWRGQQYSLALFPLWINAVISACQNVWFGSKLGFVVTPKTRPGKGARYFSLVRPQLVAMALLTAAAVWGLARLAVGLAGSDEAVPIVVNVVWIAYDLLMLSVVIDAATYQPEEEAPDAPAGAGATAAEAHGRVLAGGGR